VFGRSALCFESRPPGIIESGSGHPASTCGASHTSNRPNLRLESRRWWSCRRTTINSVPIYEFVCESCGHSFEELVGSHVGLEAADVVCPECKSAKVERRLSTSYAPLQHQMTPNQRRRLEDKRGTNRDGAKERFKRQRAAERRRGSS
jgi:putative FmdB family regulatory protein